jgi:hypothetical protein
MMKRNVIFELEQCCATCHKTAPDIKGIILKCGRCQLVYYYSSVCQKKHWAEHIKTATPSTSIEMNWVTTWRRSSRALLFLEKGGNRNRRTKNRRSTRVCSNRLAAE